MIVRDEAAILKRALLSVVDHIDYWVICDTGSRDQTPNLIQSFFAARNVPGELHRIVFDNFSQARNEALGRARATNSHFDYLLLLDADMELVVEDVTFRERLEAPAYLVKQQAGISYWNTRLLRRDAPASYCGLTHEYLDGLSDQARLASIAFIDHADGANRPNKLERDIALLRKGLEAEPDNARYVFYLAQSYRDLGRFSEAAKTYARRVTMGGWEEEIWYAQLQEARCLLALGDETAFLAAALRAVDLRPQRAEPLYDLARYYRLNGGYEAAMLFCEAARELPFPTSDRLFVEDDVYGSGIREEISISGFYCKAPARQEAGRQACFDLAIDRDAPEHVRSLARNNQIYYAPPAKSVLPSLSTKPLAFESAVAGAFMNPSVAVWNDAIYAIARNVNYRIDEDGRYIIQGDGCIATRNFLVRLDSDLRPLSWSEIGQPSNMPPARYMAVRGFEDARLIAGDAGLWCSSTVRELTEEGWCEIVLARIEHPDTPACRLTDWRILRPDGPRRHEKNWMPQVDGGTIRFIYSVDPARVVDENGRTVSETVSTAALEHVRGGSQLIPFDGGWLALSHEVGRVDGKPVYLHRLLWFDDAGALRRLTEPFYFVRLGIEFAAGLAWHPDGHRLILTFGVHDAEAWIATVSAKDVRSLLAKSREIGVSVSQGAAPIMCPPGSDRYRNAYSAAQRRSPPALTLVTCLFDLPRWDVEHGLVAHRARTLEGEGGYLRLARDLLRQDIPLVIFAEPHLLDDLTAIRPPDGRTRYHSVKLTELSLFDLYPKLAELYDDRYRAQVNPNKDTPSYLVLLNSKWSFLSWAAEADPFATPYFGWIDIGLRHVVGSEIALVPRLTDGESHPSRLCFGMPFSDAPHPPMDEIMRRFWGRIAAGLMTMPKADVSKWECLCNHHFREAVRDGCYPFESEVLLHLLLMTGKLKGTPEPSFSNGLTMAVPEVEPYQANFSQLISRHPAVSHSLSPHRTAAGDDNARWT